mmetsp:Transcript_18620/g.37724  ORF Transcript_18620/g.37724 Transcript_18620/m.37724 type:complete len:493 (-) Transcript_18620:77-1555(-)|eukprot:CAMPEP_0183304074 /NCGR_PEP_ID=MMETSP0160_2-20130417/9288_1 /TAXON_ID=2839 ORGANISM="Odontella Sinensis, Strain Grunow 1884" /NCGR_SAMPLE_ID=MMETSP0160_2 /ASSEMBLY_ACC=CAM_ASM_000250 /LENGTH=492 /DNA_ID=CAMNT_0025467063 /DNA_START=73 /DNA_END=1551 /DNA_ORIENTATION=+
MSASTGVQHFVLLLVLGASTHSAEAFVINTVNSLDCVYAPAQHSVIFPIKESDNSEGISLTEIEKGDALSSAFDAMVESSNFMFQSSAHAQSPSTTLRGQSQGHQVSSCRMPAFGTSATVTFAPLHSSCDENGDPTEYILSALNFDYPIDDFGHLCLEIYKYRDDMRGVVSMDHLRENVLDYLNSRPPDPGADAELTSSEAIGNDRLGALLDDAVDSECISKLERDGYVVIDDVIKTSQSSNDKLSQWSNKGETGQEDCRTDTVAFMNRDHAVECGVEMQYDLLLALASHLNNKMNLYESPFAPVFPGTKENPLTNPTGSNMQMAEYGPQDFYNPHSDNSIERGHHGDYIYQGSEEEYIDNLYGNDFYDDTTPWRAAMQREMFSGEKRRSNYRCITAILYLNEGWEVQDGGQLRMYLDSAHCEIPNTAEYTHNYVDVNPSNGKLLLFDSRMIHSVEKVLHQSKIRRALTLWMTRPEESGVTGERFFLQDDDN